MTAGLLAGHAADVAATFEDVVGTVEDCCVEASMMLAAYLRARGAQAEVVTGHCGDIPHALVRSDGQWVDPTAAQFGHPVQATPTPPSYFRESAWEHPLLVREPALSDITDLIAHYDERPDCIAYGGGELRGVAETLLPDAVETPYWE